MADSKTVYSSGRLFWAKIVGEKALVKNYDGDGREWAYEFEPDDTSFLKENHLLDRLKEKDDAKNPDKAAFINLRKPEFDREGQPNDPIRIYDEEGTPWDGRLIGNGTKADVKLRIVDYGKGKKSGIYTTAIRVTELVPYVSDEFGGMDHVTTKPSKAKVKAQTVLEELDETDDEIPF